MISELQIELSTRVTALLAEKGWTQVRLADEAGLSQKHLSHMLTGAEMGSLAMWSRLFFALGYRVSMNVERRA